MAKKKRKESKGIFPKLILAVFLIYAAGILVSNQIKIKKLESDTASREEIIQTEEMKKAQLEQALSAEIDDDYVTKEAQSQGYAAPNERVFVDVAGS